MKIKKECINLYTHFFGKEALEIAITVLLDGGNLLLTGEKATGKMSLQKI